MRDIHSNENSLTSTSFESLLTLEQAAEILPRVNSRRLTACTLWRWCRKGLYGVNLDHIRMGRVILTSKPALEKFFVEVAKAQRPLTKSQSANSNKAVM